MSRRTRRPVAAGIVALGMLMGGGLLAPSTAEASPGCRLPVFGPGSAYHPTIDPAAFSPRVTNRWFPLPVGKTYVYAGIKDGKKVVDIVVPSRRTRVVDGVRTRVIEDRLYLDGVLAERTADYYAQDRCGNVWYFGEDTAELDRQGTVVSTEGSFHAGVAGAQPGVFMPADPQVGQRFRQEWYAGHAEDTFSVVDLAARVTVPFGTFRHAVRTQETTALEPGVVDAKYYVAGVGEVFEGSLSGPREILRLVEVLS